MRSKECFLCGDSLTEPNYSREHVFPKWLLRRFKLFDQSLFLFDAGRTVPYRQLTIPCCNRCNNEVLSQIEREIKKAIEVGAKGFRRAGDWRLYIWLAKLFYGLLYKAHLIPLTGRPAQDGSAVSEAVLKSYGLLHSFLQASRKKVVLLRPSFPGSIFVFNLQAPIELGHQFDYRDSIDSVCVSIRMGRLGMVACLQDFGIIFEENRRWLTRLQKLKLHPVQFLEISAGLFYRARLFSTLPSYVFVQDSASEIGAAIGAMTSEDWDQADYAQMLSAFTGYPLDVIYHPPRNVMSWLHDERGRPKYIDLETYPWPHAKSPSEP